MFSREDRRQQRAKSKHIFEIEEGRRVVEVVGCLPFGVSTGGRCVGSLGLQDLPEVGSGPLVVCSVLLSALSLCLWCVVFEYGFISRFKGVFSAVWAFRVGLCCLGALRGLCGFVRVWS